MKIRIIKDSDQEHPTSVELGDDDRVKVFVEGEHVMSIYHFTPDKYSLYVPRPSTATRTVWMKEDDV